MRERPNRYDWKSYEGQPSVGSNPTPSAQTMAKQAKYHRLFEHLCRAAPDEPIELSFDEVGELVGGLPATARTLASWWANDANGPKRVQAKAWLDAGRQVEKVDREAGVVRFSAPRWNRGS